jgi:plasmid stability protein
MRRTTLVIDDGVFRQLKKKAAEEGRTFQAMANDLLRQALAQPERRDYRLILQGWKAEQQPGVNICDRDKLFELMDGR